MRARSSIRCAVAVFGLCLAPLVLALPPTGRLSGTVVDDQGHPVVELNLQFKAADKSGNPARTLKTGKSGAFSHAFFPAGSYHIAIEDPGRFIKSLTYVLKNESGVELARQSGEGRPDEALPPFVIGFDQRVELALVLASRQRDPQPTGATAPSKTTEALVKLKALYEAGEMGPVVEQGSKLVEEQPDLGLAHYLLGMAQARQGQTDAALTSLGKARELMPEQQGVAGALGTVMLQKGRALSAAGQAVQAEEQFTRAAAALGQELERFGPAAVYLANRAAALEAAGNLEEFGRALESLVQVEPGNLAAWLRLVELQAESGKLDAALESLRRAPASEPREVALSAHNLAVRAFNVGDMPRAVSAAELGISADPTMPALYRVLGRASFSLNDSRAAIAALRKVLELAPNDPEAATDRRMLEKLEAGGS